MKITRTTDTGMKSVGHEDVEQLQDGPPISDRRALSALGMARARRLVLVLVSTVLATVALVVVGPVSPAAADTKSCQLYGGGNVSGTWIPSGTYCLTRVGSGTWVSGVQGEWYGPKLCNYEVTAEFFNRDWGYRGPTRYSSRNYGCAYGSTWMPYIRVNSSMQGLTGTPSGYLCSTLRIAGQKVTSSCQYIY